MNRIQKKCFIASTGIHLLLMIILIIGPAFLSKESPVDESQILEFIPVITTDLKASGGGDPNVKSLPAAERQAPPVPEPPKPPVRSEVPPEPVQKSEPKPAPEPEKRDPDAVEVTEKPRKPQVNLKLVKRPTTQTTAKARADQQAREAAERQRKLAQQLDRAVSGIKGGLSSSTEIRLKGPGGGGVPYANFLDAVKSVYARDWSVPDGAADDSATATAAIVIAKDGRVLSARIIKSSGNATVDRSVQITLDRVKFAAPLPPTAKESQREVTINFNVRAARLLLG